MAGYIIAIIILGAALAATFSWALKLSKRIEGQERDSGALQEKTRILQELLDKSETERKAAEALRDQALREKNAAETDKKLAEQRALEIESRAKNLEKTKDDIMQAHKAAAGEIFKKEVEELNKKTLQDFQNLTSTVAALKNQSEKSESSLAVVMRSLSTSSAIGQFSEDSLLNTLKQYGLIEGKDFLYQASFQTGDTSRRPDFVIKMPGNNLIVIDSKASQFFFELAEQEGTGREPEILAKLKKRMNDHLNSLVSKEYHESVKKIFEKSGWREEPGIIYTILFLHNDSQIEKICRIDSGYQQKCINNGVILTGPTGLSGPLTAASIFIEKERQSKNQEAIIAELQSLLGSFAVSLGHVEKVSRSIRNAYEHFRNFAASVNKNILPKARRLQSHGISLPKGKELPESIRLYDDAATIEGEAEEVVVRLPVANEQ